MMVHHKWLRHYHTKESRPRDQVLRFQPADTTPLSTWDWAHSITQLNPE